MPNAPLVMYHDNGDGTKDTSKMLLTVSSFGESHRRRSPAVAFLSGAKQLSIFGLEGW
jgi:hypothetical protein